MILPGCRVLISIELVCDLLQADPRLHCRHRGTAADS
jgi:hypothetical protein